MKVLLMSDGIWKIYVHGTESENGVFIKRQVYEKRKTRKKSNDYLLFVNNLKDHSEINYCRLHALI